MITLQQITKANPAVAWSKHRFYETLSIPSAPGQILMYGFEIPQTKEMADSFLLTGDKVRADFKELLKDSPYYPRICDDIAHLLNQRMKLVQRDVIHQLRLVSGILHHLVDQKYVTAYVLATQLVSSLMIYHSQLWLYEWEEWVDLVDNYISQNADPVSLNVIKKLPKPS